MKERMKALWTKLNTDVPTLWNESKVFLIAFGAIIAVLKFKDLFVNVLIASAENIFKNTTDRSDSLNNQENQNNESADQLINDAKNLPDQEPPVSDGWNLKKDDK